MKKFSNLILLAGVLTMAFMVDGINNFAHAEINEVQQLQKEMLNLVNIERAKYGLRPLVLDSSLNNGAMIRAREISTYFSHKRPDGSSCFSVLGNYRKSYLGENISAGRSSPKETNNSWMKSQGHRENILNNKFRYLGVGYY